MPSGHFDRASLIAGDGAVPNSNAIKAMNQRIDPFRKCAGDVGFLDVGKVFPMEKVVVTEDFGDTKIATSYNLDASGGKARDIDALQTALQVVKSSVGLKSVTACVSGSYWFELEAWRYVACYERDADRNWVLVSFKTWPARFQEP